MNRFLFTIFITALLGVTVAQAEDSISPLPDELRPMRVGGVALVVSDIEKSKTFYTEVLGMKVGGRGPEEGPARYYTLGMTGDRMADTLLVLTQGKPELSPEPGATKFGRVIFFVPDAGKLAERAEAEGYTARKVKEEISVLHDLDGYVIELISRPEEAAKGLPSNGPG